jgi:hypothetical protein
VLGEDPQAATTGARGKTENDVTAGRTGRPPLTEERKAEIRLEIAHAAALRHWRPDRPPAEALDFAAGKALAGPEPAAVGALVRLTRTEPGLRAIWLQTHDEAEPAFARALAERAGLLAGDLRPVIQAAMFNAALRVAVEHPRLAHGRHRRRPGDGTGSTGRDAARGAGGGGRGAGVRRSVTAVPGAARITRPGSGKFPDPG